MPILSVRFRTPNPTMFAATMSSMMLPSTHPDSPNDGADGAVRVGSCDRRTALRSGMIACAASLIGRTSIALADDPADDFGEAPRKGAAGEEVGKASDIAGDVASPRLSYDNPKTQVWRIGLRLDAKGVECNDVWATFPVPMAWPEQTVRMISQEIDARVDRWSVRDLPGGARQVVLAMPRVAAGSVPEVIFEIEVTRSRIVLGDQTEDLVIPKRPSTDLKIFLGTSPYIDIGDSRIKSAARDFAAAEHANAWTHVEAIYDWVREKVEYVEGDIKTASQALRDGKGDCEEMTSLFVAVCRASRIPARMVWIPDHCYPEFYLEDSEGAGTWFPCQAAGTRQFGGMDEYRPVLQKGDRFKVPEVRKPVRYVAEFFRCVPVGKREPNPIFIREILEG